MSISSAAHGCVHVVLPVATTQAADPTSGLDCPAVSRGIIATWRERIHFRWELARLLANTPELIDDIGLTRRALEVEVAKPFWSR